jgi:hypothetical protein
MPAVAEDLGVDHPAAEELDPARVLADAAPRVRPVGPHAEHAARVDLGARLDEGEVARAETHRRAGPVEALGEGREHALEVREADALVHQEALDLVEHGRVRESSSRRYTAPALTTAMGGRCDDISRICTALVCVRSTLLVCAGQRAWPTQKLSCMSVAG